MISCKSITKTYLGVKNPSFKTHKELNDFITRNQVNTNSIFYFKNFETMIQGYQLKYSSIPDAYFFNQNGDFIPYKNDAENCNAKVDDFIAELKNINLVTPENIRTKNIKNFIPLLSNDKNEEMVLNDITVIITWATFLGKVNKQKAFEWIKLLEDAKSKGININYYLVNYDLQESWGLNDKEKKEIRASFKE